MNFLAHLALAENSDASLVGNLLGDFAKGTESHLRSILPTDVVHGIMMHRRIDHFTDHHPTFQHAKMLISPARRRFAGVVVDIIYDHFLSRHWDYFHAPPREQFITHCYRTLQNHPEWLRGRLLDALPTMLEQDWLGAYLTREGIQLTLQRVSQRSRFSGPIAAAHDDFIRHYHDYERLFLEFYPDLQNYAKGIS